MAEKPGDAGRIPGPGSAAAAPVSSVLASKSTVAIAITG
jgi:hypothetical protein